jgi:transcriptional regulator with XRE-family HTH domain
MSRIGKNIRKIRATKGLSQAAFANLFSITRASIGAYEEERAEPKTDIMLQIANYFSIPIEALLTEELTVNRLTNFNIKAVLDENTSKQKKSIPFITSWNWNHFFNNEESTDETTIDFPNNFINGEIAIEITNQIQTDFENGTIVICNQVNSPTEDTLYLLILKEKSLIISLTEFTSLKIKKPRLYIINQKIESINHNSKSSLEERVNKLEKEIKTINQQLNG